MKKFNLNINVKKAFEGKQQKDMLHKKKIY